VCAFPPFLWAPTRKPLRLRGRGSGESVEWRERVRVDHRSAEVPGTKRTADATMRFVRDLLGRAYFLCCESLPALKFASAVILTTRRLTSRLYKIVREQSLRLAHVRQLAWLVPVEVSLSLRT